MTISVLLVDDSVTFLRATTQFLEAHDDIVVIGTAADGKEALTRAETLRPQVILIDLAMPGLPGLEAIPRLRSTLPEVGIIALTVMNTNGFRQAALAAGANTFISKTSMRSDLLPAIRELVEPGRKKAAKPTTAAPPSSAADGAPGLRRVLIMEDDTHLRRLFGKALRTSGYDVHTAATTQEARDILAQVRFDLLLCDIHIGDDRGTDLLHEYAETFATGGTQVVMVSGEVQYRDMCEEMGADFFLEKPVAVGTLVTLVDRLTARHR